MNSFSKIAFTLPFVLAAALPARATLDADPAPPITLDQIDVTADKEKHFSLPLDATPPTGSRLGLSNRDLPASVSVVTQEMMRLRGYRTAVEAVEGAVGMTGGTAFGSIPAYAARGFAGNAVTIMRDGIRQNTASQSSRTTDSFLLDRVEILKGPASLLFGEGAVGGAVNYVSKSPDRTRRSETFASYGAWNTVRAALGTGGPVPLRSADSQPSTLNYRFDYSYQATDGYVDGNAQRYHGFGGALDYAVTPVLRLKYFSTFLRDHNASYYGNPVIYDAVDRFDPATGAFTRVVSRAVAATDRLVNARVDSAARRTNYNIPENYAETDNSFNRLRAEWTPAPDWEIRNEAYVSTQLLKWVNLESNLWNPATRLVDRSSFVTIYRDDVLTGNRLDVTNKSALLGRTNRFLLGALLENNDQIRGGTPGNIPTTLAGSTLLNPLVGTAPAGTRFQKTSRIVVRTHAFYAENALDLTASLKLLVGLRYDRISLRRDTLANPTATPAAAFATFKKGYRPWTGRTGLVYAVTKDVNLYAGFSRAAEPVSQLVGLTVANADFSLQRGRQYEIGAKGTLARGRLDFTFAVFDIEKQDLLSSTLAPVTGLRINQQIGAQAAQGAELALAFSPARDWRLEGNVAWTWQTEFKDFNENLGAGIVSRSGNTPPNVPDLVAGAYVAKTFGTRWRLGGGPRYVAPRTANNANYITTPGYTTLEASVSYNAGRWSATLRGRNLLDREYEEWATAGGLMRRLADPRNAELSLRTSF